VRVSMVVQQKSQSLMRNESERWETQSHTRETALDCEAPPADSDRHAGNCVGEGVALEHAR